jgi:hypothetical protein
MPMVLAHTAPYPVILKITPGASMNAATISSPHIELPALPYEQNALQHFVQIKGG